jgi:hypothetical protein
MWIIRRKELEETMQFVETLDGALVPLSRIDRLWSKAGSVWIKADDETHQIIGTLDKIRDALEPIIPASLGWEVITPAENNDGFLVSVYCGTVLRQPTALIQAAKDSSPTFAMAPRS